MVCETQNYLYLHLRKSDRQPFYVGIGRGGRASWRYGRNPYWQKIARKHGFAPEILQRDLSKTRACELEQLVIANMRAAGIQLANLTEGGEYPAPSRVRTAEEKKATAIKKKAWWNSLPAEDKQRRVANFVHGTCKTHTEATRRKLSISHLGKRHSEDQRKKISEGVRKTFRAKGWNVNG